MAGLDRNTFDLGVADVFDKACENLERDGQVAHVITMLNKKGQHLGQILEVNPDVPEADQKMFTDAGLTLVEGPLRDRQEEIRQVVREHRADAVIIIAEVWSRVYDPEGVDAPGHEFVPASETPGRREEVIVVGLWPNVAYYRVYTARIVRDPDGKPFTIKDEAPGDAFGHWMANLLPS